tara:strand:- start:112 stop:387 length:276 start_codon:yes stop_codon:yes gene_type:complete
MILNNIDYVTIHQAIHDKDKSQVTIKGTKYSVSLNNNGCRSVKIPGTGTFIEQNTEKDTVYGKRAKAGEFITWLIRDKSWGLIVNDEVINQ